jgi:transcription initiation factor TFIIB
MRNDSSRGEDCSKCGFVVREKTVETGPEWRSFSNEEKDERSRTGLPTSITIHDTGLATIIGGEKQGRGRQVALRSDEVERRPDEDMGQEEPGA